MRVRDQRGGPPGGTPRWPPTGTGAMAVNPRRTARRHPRARRVVRAALAALLLLVAMVGLVGWRLETTATSYPGPHFNTGANAVWLEHTWSGQPHSASDYDQLAARLASEQIRYVFAHVGPLDSDGSIPASRAPYAGALAAALHQRLPGVRVLAWIGQLEAASHLPANQVVNLDDSAVRERIAATAARFVRAGMDGVHYDIEPIINNNPRFLDLLDETRAALPAGAIISVSAEKWAPSARVASWANSAGRADGWWTTYYYAQVAAHADQIVVMAYNTAMPTAALYSLVVKEETQHILEAARAAPHPAQVLIGVPTYAGNDFWFHASAENMTSGLQGVIAGLNSDRVTQPFAGVAIYRLATTSAASWATYDRLWLGR